MRALNPPILLVSGTTDESKQHLVFVLNVILFSLLCFLDYVLLKRCVSSIAQTRWANRSLHFVSLGFIYKPMARICGVRRFSWGISLGNTQNTVFRQCLPSALTAEAC